MTIWIWWLFSDIYIYIYIYITPDLYMHIYVHAQLDPLLSWVMVCLPQDLNITADDPDSDDDGCLDDLLKGPDRCHWRKLWGLMAQLKGGDKSCGIHACVIIQFYLWAPSGKPKNWYGIKDIFKDASVKLNGYRGLHGAGFRGFGILQKHLKSISYPRGSAGNWDG